MRITDIKEFTIIFCCDPSINTYGLFSSMSYRYTVIQYILCLFTNLNLNFSHISQKSPMCISSFIQNEQRTLECDKHNKTFACSYRHETQSPFSSLLLPFVHLSASMSSSSLIHHIPHGNINRSQ